MKRFILLLILSCFVVSSSDVLARNKNQNSFKGQVESLVKKHDTKKGCESTSVNAKLVSTALNVLAKFDDLDEEEEQVLKLMSLSGIDRVLFFDYDDVSYKDRAEIIKDLNSLMQSTTLLTEMKSDDDIMRISICPTENEKIVSAIVMQVEELYVFFFGNISLDNITELITMEV